MTKPNRHQITEVLTVFLLGITILALPGQAKAKINWPWQQEPPARQEVREQIQEQIQEQLGLTGTPAEGQNQIRQQIREQIREQVQEIKDRLAWILPSGLNQVEMVTVSGTTPPAELGVSKEGESYTIKVVESTRLLRKFGGQALLSEFSAGDLVSARGKWLNGEKTILEARVVRNLSIQKRRATFWGVIKSINLRNRSFILTSAQRGDQEVFSSSSTKILNRRNQKIAFEDLKVEDRVRVSGLWDSKLKKINQVTRIKDWSIAPLPIESEQEDN